MQPWMWTLLIGALIGKLAGMITSGGGFGLIGDIIIGIAGAFMGAWLVGVLHIAVPHTLLGHLMTALGGAIVLVSILRVIRSV